MSVEIKGIVMCFRRFVPGGKVILADSFSCILVVNRVSLVVSIYPIRICQFDSVECVPSIGYLQFRNVHV